MSKKKDKELIKALKLVYLAGFFISKDMISVEEKNGTYFLMDRAGWEQLPKVIAQADYLEDILEKFLENCS